MQDGNKTCAILDYSTVLLKKSGKEDTVLPVRKMLASSSTIAGILYLSGKMYRTVSSAPKASFIPLL